MRVEIFIFLSFLVTGGYGWSELNTGVNRTDYEYYPQKLTGQSSVIWRDRYIIIFGGQYSKTHRVMDMLPIIHPNNETTPYIANCTHLNNCTGYGSCELQNDGNFTCSCIDGFAGHMCQLGIDYDHSSDVWIFDMDLETWHRRRYSGDHDRLNTARYDQWPFRRYHHTAEISADTMYIFGGYGRDFLDYSHEVWEYNIDQGYSWSDDGYGRWYRIKTYRHNTRIGPRAMHASVWVDRTYHDLSTGQQVSQTGMFVYGGLERGEVVDELWFYPRLSPLTEGTYPAHVRVWIQYMYSIRPGYEPGVGGRIRSAMEFSKTRDMIYLVGGFSSPFNTTSNFVAGGSEFYKDYQGVVWQYNFTALEWSYIRPEGTYFPPEAMGLRMTHALDCLVVFGGYRANKEYGSIWRFNLTSNFWVEQELHYSMTTEPTKRYDHTFLYRNYTQHFYVFGGSTSRSTVGETRIDYRLNDIWKFDGLWCPNNCADRGECIFGYCFCEEGYWGFDCQENMCPGSNCWYSKETLKQECKMCNNRGQCRDGVCRCNDGYNGLDCKDIFCEYDCHNRGNCTETGNCISYRFDMSKFTFTGNAGVITTSTGEAVVQTGNSGTTTYVTIPVETVVRELAGIKLGFRYQTITPPMPGFGPIVNYYIYHKEGHSIVQSYFGTTGVLDDYYRDIKPDLWSPVTYFKKNMMNVYVSDMKTIDIVLEIQNQARSLLIRPEVTYDLCFLTNTKQDLQCKCEDGWWGRLCDKKWCECSGHGGCSAINGTCECDILADGSGAWVGHNCSIFKGNDAGITAAPSFITLGILVMIGTWFNV